VQNPLAVKLLEAEFGDGDTIVVDRVPGTTHLTFHKSSQTAAVA
jgi:hypothetical protein